MLLRDRSRHLIGNPSVTAGGMVEWVLGRGIVNTCFARCKLDGFRLTPGT